MAEAGFDIAALRAALAGSARVARVVVAETAGSAPRGPGAAMLVWDGGQSGTIGGGALEWQAITQARAMLAGNGPAQLARLPLGPGLGQCCGGAVTLAFQIWDATRLAALPEGAMHVLHPACPQAAPLPPPALTRAAARAEMACTPAPVLLAQGWLLEPVARPAQQLWVWGAGHVGRAVVALMAPLPDWHLTWIDVDAAAFPPEIPARVRALHDPDPARLVATSPRNAQHLVMTRSHPLDLAICHQILTHGASFAGLIGSATKWARFQARLRALGHGPAQIARIRCPIGTPELGKHPQAIAIGVAQDLIRPAPQRWEQAAG